MAGHSSIHVDVVAHVDTDSFVSAISGATRAICAHRGHRLDGDNLIHYLDGVIVARCVSCDERFDIRWIPGGTAALKARALVDSIIGTDDLTDEAVHEFQQVMEMVQADVELLEDTVALIEVCKAVIARRLRG